MLHLQYQMPPKPKLKTCYEEKEGEIQPVYKSKYHRRQCRESFEF